MRTTTTIATSLLTATVLAVSGCSSTSSTGSSSSSTSSSSSAGSGQRSGGTGGGMPGGGSATVTAVNLNTDGASPGGANTAAVATAVKAFLATLDDSLRSKVEFAFSDNASRQTWSNYPAFQVPRKGVNMAALSAAQRTSLYAALQVALSSDGAKQDTEIQKADDYLNSLGGQGADGFGSLKDYYIAIYGTPSTTSPFMVQFGGHHLARNLTYNGDKVSETPQFVGSEPTTFTSDGTSLSPVAAESTGMFAMMAALTADQKKAAQITSATFDDLLVGPGKDSGTFPTSEGLSVSKLTAAQKKLVMTAIQAYVGDLSSGAASKLMAKYSSELDQTTIGWTTNTGPTDENSYIRIDGPSVWIEFINTRSQSTPSIHFHSVYRDKTNDYGSTKPS